jgi:hypothetical protein
MKTLNDFQSIRTTKDYDGFLKALYAGVKWQVDISYEVCHAGGCYEGGLDPVSSCTASRFEG